jgi:hypothetical protein
MGTDAYVDDVTEDDEDLMEALWAFRTGARRCDAGNRA